MSYIRCPKCGTHRVRRSRRRNILELAAVLATPYRCVPCDERFFAWRWQEARDFSQASGPVTKGEHGERRNSGRVSLQRTVEFRVLDSLRRRQPESGVTINMSDSGILFTSDLPLLAGSPLEMKVGRPGRQPLMVRGRVVRHENGVTAAQVLPPPLANAA